jgi:hypothetical protein
LQRIKEERNILHTIKRREANWIGHVFCKNFLLKYNFEGKIEIRIEVTGGRERSLKQLQGYLKKARGTGGRGISLQHLQDYLKKARGTGG